jgi:two-component system chemotaxis response regulator CheB
VLHLPENHESQLVPVFRTRVGLPVREAEPHAPGGGRHAVFRAARLPPAGGADRSFSLSCDPPVLFSRPSIDVLLESCADAYGEGLAGMILTGANEDGARGLARVRPWAGSPPCRSRRGRARRHAAAAPRWPQPDFVLPLAGLRACCTLWCAHDRSPEPTTSTCCWSTTCRRTWSPWRR